MNWLTLAILAVFSISLANLFQRALMREDRSDPALFSIIFQYLITFLSLIFALYKGFVFPRADLWPNLLIGAILYGLGVIFNFKAAKKVEIANLVIIGTLGPVITIIFAVLLLKETFGAFKVIGTGLIIISIFILYVNKKMRFEKGFFYALISALFLA